jgi:hypothetical protein
VSFAALIDAVRHRGPAIPTRFSRTVCSHPYAPGLSALRIEALNAVALPTILARVLAYPPARREPPVRAYAKS